MIVGNIDLNILLVFIPISVSVYRRFDEQDL